MDAAPTVKGLSLAGFEDFIASNGLRAAFEGKTMGNVTAAMLHATRSTSLAAQRLASPHLGRPNVFLSFSDADHFLDVFDALGEWQARQPMDSYFYVFDVLIANVLERDGRVPFEERYRLLSSAILEAGRVLLVMDKAASAASDLWCALEVALAQELCVPLEVAMAPRFVLDVVSLLSRDPTAVLSMFCIDVEGASTSDAADAVGIRRTISDGIDYLRVNQAIVCAMQEWAVTQGHIKLASMDEDERGLSPHIDGLAILLQGMGRLAEAEPLLRESLAVCRRRLGDDHCNTLASLENLACLLHDEGKLAEAELLSQETLHGRRRTHGTEHPRYLVALFNYAKLLWSRGRLDEAMPMFEEELATSRRVLGATHRNTIVSMSNMGRLLLEEKRFCEAENLIRATLAIRQRTLGADHSDTLMSLANLAKLLQIKKQFDEADLMFRRVLDVRQRTLGDDHPFTIEIVHNIGLLRCDQGDLDSALEHLMEAFERGREALGSRHPDVLCYMNDAACVLLARDRTEEALILLAEAAPGMQDVLGRDHPDTRGVTANWASALVALVRPDESAAVIALLPPFPAEVVRHPHDLSPAPTAAVARLPAGWGNKCSLCRAARLGLVHCCSEADCRYAVCMRCHAALKV